MREWLPIYLIERLNRTQESLTRRWVAGDELLRNDVAGLQILSSAVRQQPEPTPDPKIIERINAAILDEKQIAYSNRRLVIAWVSLLLVAILGLVFLWRAYPPGVVLNWSIQGGTPELFRVYRAEQKASTLAEDTFQLLEEVPVDGSVVSYNFTDWIPSLDKEYVYRVEAVDRSGKVAAGQSVVADGIDTLPGQVVLLFGTMLVAGIIIQLLTTGWRRPILGYRLKTIA